MKQKKAQSTLEYMSIFVIAFGIIGVLAGMFMVYTNEAKKGFDVQTMNSISQEIMDNVNRIYFLGEGNRVTINTNFPQGVENFTLHHVNQSGEVYDYLNVTYIQSNQNQLNSLIFLAEESYIRFNCTNCYQTAKVDNNWLSWYNRSDHNTGLKKIRIQSQGDWVSVDFIKQ